ncbi:unnamed protein product [Bursaphelenchus okinawaensis]|uniref:Uncharacterized protein n=1 Tax=Bursaphelenchus okinawaensis TaxID=465554 RepID=A0A811L894_9BILA|nr:unnamed protein product [Bursaphelenchus okinawaensis]CAG9118103.1 unnamed protein product [Bursaphelenchus okinawaensis]
MQSGGGGGSTSGCPAVPGEVLLAGDFVSSSSFYGEVAPISTCTTCAAGTAKYYPDSGDPNIVASEQKAIGASGNGPANCANLCVCSADGTCYTRSTQNVNVVLYPYCDGASCAVYVMIVTQDDSAGLQPSNGGPVVTGSAQVDPTTLDYKPVTDPSYPQVTYASCNGCPNGPTSC